MLQELEFHQITSCSFTRNNMNYMSNNTTLFPLATRRAKLQNIFRILRLLYLYFNNSLHNILPFILSPFPFHQVLVNSICLYYCMHSWKIPHKFPHTRKDKRKQKMNSIYLSRYILKNQIQKSD